MKAPILLLLLMLRVPASCWAQHNAKACTLVIDPDLKAAVRVYAIPQGKLVAALKQDFKNEDVLLLTVTKETAGFFYGTLAYALSGKAVLGWIRKSDYIGTYARNYAPGVPLKLYAQPSTAAAVSVTITDWNPNLYPVTSCSKGWVLIKTMNKGSIKKGWLAPNMQCDNPYTTCN